jgi:IMP dehydrogenase
VKRLTVRDADQLMLEHDIEQIPVVTGDELYGVVRDIDLLEAL